MKTRSLLTIAASGALFAVANAATAQDAVPVDAGPGTMPGAQDTTAAYPPPPPQTVYPRCSATVQDQCIQSSARESDYKGGPPANPRKRLRRR